MTRSISKTTYRKNRVRSRKWKQVNEGKYNTYIKQYQQTKGKERRRFIREKLNQICSVPCFDCGVPYPPYCMDFDHLPQYTKRFNISAFGSRSWQTILDEILKCDIVCAVCHRKRTHKRLSGR